MSGLTPISSANITVNIIYWTLLDDIAENTSSTYLDNNMNKPLLISAGCPAVREKSGKFQTWQKSGKSQGILLKVREKNEYWEKSGKSQGICI